MHFSVSCLRRLFPADLSLLGSSIQGWDPHVGTFMSPNGLALGVPLFPARLLCISVCLLSPW